MFPPCSPPDLTSGQQAAASHATTHMLRPHPIPAVPAAKVAAVWQGWGRGEGGGGGGCHPVHRCRWSPPAGRPPGCGWSLRAGRRPLHARLPERVRGPWQNFCGGAGESTRGVGGLRQATKPQLRFIVDAA